MANSIARQPGRLGVLLLLLVAVIAGLMIMQISRSDSVDKADDGLIVEQAGVIETERAAATPAGTGVLPIDPASVGNTDFSGLTAADYILYNDFGGSAVNPGGTGDTSPPAVPAKNTGSLSGTVMDTSTPDGAAIPRISVYLARSDGVFTGVTAMTESDGSFLFEELAPGAYKLYFFDIAGSWRASWYGGPEVSAGLPVVVGAGDEIQVVQGLKRADLEDGTISGKVTDSVGNGVAGVDVMAFYVDEAGGAMLLLKGSSVTDAEGNYAISGLPSVESIVPGDDTSDVAGYKVQFVPPGDLYATQWYNGQPTHLTAKLLQIKPAGKLGGIDAILSGGGAKTEGVITELAQPKLITVQVSTVAGAEAINGTDNAGEAGSLEAVGEAGGLEPVEETGSIEPADETGDEPITQPIAQPIPNFLVAAAKK